MSVKELKLEDGYGNSLILKNRKDIEGFSLHIKDSHNGLTNAYITKEQAHLLYLYLQEHFEEK